MRTLIRTNITQNDIEWYESSLGPIHWFYIATERGGRSGWIFDRKNHRPLMRPVVETDRKTLHNGSKPSIIPDVVIQDDQ